MSTAVRYVAEGKVTRTAPGAVVFAPANTTYQFELEGDSFAGEIGRPVSLVIRAGARKVMTVPAGGNWVQPISGPPRVVQGRVRSLEDGWLVVQAGTIFHIQLPESDRAIDLNNGAIAVGEMVNVTLLPGVRYEIAAPADRR